MELPDVMECWTTPDDGHLVKLDSLDSCASEQGDEVWVLLDPWGDIAQVWRDDTRVEDDAECRVTYEVEGYAFIGVLEQRFESGRTNFSREVEIDEILPTSEDADGVSTESTVRSALEEWRAGPAAQSEAQ